MSFLLTWYLPSDFKVNVNYLKQPPEVVYVKSFLKMLQISQENNCIGISWNLRNILRKLFWRTSERLIIVICVIKWKRQIWNGCYQRFYGGENQMKTTGCFMTVNKFQLTCSITFQLTLVYQISFHLENAYWYMQNYSAKKNFMQKIPLIHSKSML